MALPKLVAPELTALALYRRSPPRNEVWRMAGGAAEPRECGVLLWRKRMTRTAVPFVAALVWGASSIATACGGRSSLDLTGNSTTPAAFPPRSCTPGGDGLTNCGPSLESCCAGTVVLGGTYNRTYTNSGSGPTGEADPATVSTFQLDKYDVTVGRFRQFVRAWNGGAGYVPPAGSGKHTHLNGGNGLANSASSGGYETGWLASDDANLAPTSANLNCGAPGASWTDSPGAQENLAINCVTWYEAYAFCIWDGGFLPSEAEWEYAAAGGDQQRQYPWGTAAPGMENQYAIYECYYPSETGLCGASTAIAPVGTAALGEARWGQLDIVGEVWQWNLDWYADYMTPCVDCAYLTETTLRVFRGTNFDGGIGGLWPSFRGSGSPSIRNGDYGGLRCARTP